MRHIHTSIVSRHLATRGNNKILRTPPPHTSSSEERLPCPTRRTLAQPRTNKSPFLKSYLHKVDAKSHPSPCKHAKARSGSDQYLGLSMLKPYLRKPPAKQGRPRNYNILKLDQCQDSPHQVKNNPRTTTFRVQFQGHEQEKRQTRQVSSCGQHCNESGNYYRERTEYSL